jgi:hypothetical protein
MDAVTSDDDQIRRWFTPNAVKSPRRSDRVRTERGSSARARSGPPRVPVDGTPVDRAGGVLAGARAKAVRGRDRRVK